MKPPLPRTGHLPMKHKKELTPTQQLIKIFVDGFLLVAIIIIVLGVYG